ncbi:hypothetical protein Salat_2678000 [Sesamum alatum]|uniref:Uncharacterized protein n=1 Tax=Sesamum alatum TaxID=300844 RepID=A0AAE1XPQ5_9LAMI|nr:hypothetical protein Salat_2678000 [Sesamum alatum]
MAATYPRRRYEKPVISAKELAVEIFRSFFKSLEVLSSCAVNGSAQIPAVDSGGSPSCSGETKKKSGVKDWRGGFSGGTTETAAKAEVAAAGLELWYCNVVRTWVRDGDSIHFPSTVAAEAEAVSETFHEKRAPFVALWRGEATG